MVFFSLGSGSKLRALSGKVVGTSNNPRDNYNPLQIDFRVQMSSKPQCPILGQVFPEGHQSDWELSF